MTRRTSGEATIADVPQTTKPPADIAAAVAAASEELRRESHRQDVQRWRVIVGSIADGHEPEGEKLRDIAELAARLKLPEGSLARHVAAITLERRLRADLKKAEDETANAERRSGALAKEIEQVQRRLHELRVETEAAMWRGCDVGNLRSRIDDHQAAHPLVWGDIDKLANSMAHDGEVIR
jgi:chromosome segregation ATPase